MIIHRCLAILTITMAACAPRREPPPAPPSGEEAGDAELAARAEMAEHGGSAAHALHMRLTPERTPMPADSAQSARVVAALRRATARYADPRAAEADGYRLFLPGVEQRVYHYTSYGNAFKEAFRFDPARPTSLLYADAPPGGRRLVGAMYSVPRRMPVAKLDARVPLSMARWHQHVNWCRPARGDERRWSETRDGAPLFGPESPVATRAACDAVGGQFREHVFGWMVHVDLVPSGHTAHTGHGAVP